MSSEERSSDASATPARAGTSGAARPPRGVRLPRSARRAQLLRSAQEVFVSRGYHGAGMDEIADRAGVSKPVLYQHFPGKLELYLALFETANERMLETVAAALGAAGTSKDRVFATIAAYFDFVAQDDGAYRLVFESDLTNVPEVAARAGDVQHRCAVTVAGFLREDTDMTEPEALLIATGIVGLAQTSARHWLTHSDGIPREDAAMLVARMAWRGVRRRPSEAEQAQVAGG